MPLAALVYRDGLDPAPVLQEIAATLRERGVALGGAVQHGDVGCAMTLELLPSGVRVPISQNLGSGASGCRLDSVGLAEAASLVRKSIDAAPALAIFNKFGSQEAAGSGMHAEMVAAVTSGIPILTAVRDTLLPQWAEFTGGQSVQLDCSVDAALAWWESLQAA